jgi:glycosyltransferase involved in cell wall biosynthesis
VLILVENLSVPLDRRVWNECGTLTAAGYRVSVVCPRGAKHDRRFYEEIDGVRIYRYPTPPSRPGLAGYVVEYGYMLLMTGLLALAVFAREPFDAIHACNPPDLFVLVAWPFRLLGVSFLFDQHDACPEILVAKRGGEAGAGLPELVVRWAERATYAAADVVVSPNESYRAIALGRGKKAHDDVFVVRSAPRLAEFPSGGPASFDRRGHEFLVGYLGVMGLQDGVDVLLEALALLIRRGYDVLAYLAGAGESYEALAREVVRLGLQDRVLMPGYQYWSEFAPALRNADVCVAPDPPGPFNDISTMNKIIEYMAFGRAGVAFDLTENRVTGGDAVVYAGEATAEGLAEAIAAVLDMGAAREDLGRAARRRFEEMLAWEHQESALLAAYGRLAAEAVAQPAAGTNEGA